MDVSPNEKTVSSGHISIKNQHVVLAVAEHKQVEVRTRWQLESTGTSPVPKLRNKVPLYLYLTSWNISDNLTTFTDSREHTD